MGALDAFYSTWSDARETFGQGTPQDGSKLDNSSQLMQMKAGVEAAAPDGRWQGPASEAYGAKNKEHAGVYGKLAELDTKMATEVTNASNVVTAGRQSLDITKSWVDSAVKALPSGLSASDRDAKLLSIANEGIGKVSTIVTEATNKMTDINGRVQGIKGQWHALGNEFGEPKIDGLFTDEESAAFARAKAESDVHKALAGDKKSAAEVARILDSISEEQKRTGRPPLTPQQGSYLSQMQAQQNGMSVDALKRAKDNLKEQGHIIGDSWQLMSNPKLEFPKTKLEQYELDNPNEKLSGGYEQLPRQVKEAIDSFAWTGKDEISDIANIVENGADRFQTNTDLDRALIQKADDWMNTREWTHARAGEDRYDSPVGAVLAAVSPDHQVVHDMITGANGAGGSKFVDNIAQHYWTDDGKSAASLFSWTEAAAAGPESQIAAETAHAYATYVGEGAPKLADLMEPSPGKANPALVQGIAHGLSPYIENLAGQSNEYSQWFPAPDTAGDIENHKMPIAKGVFSVISTDETASDYFNGKAYANVIRDQISYAAAIGAHEPNAIVAHDAEIQRAVVLQGLIDAGTHNAAEWNELGTGDAYDRKSAAFDIGIKTVSALGGPVLGPLTDMTGTALKTSMIGPDPSGGSSMGDYTEYNIYAQVLSGLNMSGYSVDLPASYLAPADPSDPNGPQLVASFESAKKEDPSLTVSAYNAALLQAVSGYGVDTSAIGLKSGLYNAITEDPSPWD